MPPALACKYGTSSPEDSAPAASERVSALGSSRSESEKAEDPDRAKPNEDFVAVSTAAQPAQEPLVESLPVREPTPAQAEEIVVQAPAASAASPAPRDNPLKGILLIVVSTLFLAGSDVVSKYLTASLPAIEVAWLRYATFVAIMASIVIFGRRFGTLRSRRPGLQLLRGIGLVASSLLFMSSLPVLPIAEATATSFVSPIFVTALSIPFLGEKVGWRRWGAAFVGLAGVMIVVQPGGHAFQAASILPLLSALAWAFALIMTRKMHAEGALTTLACSALVGFCVLSLLAPLVWVPPSWEMIALGAFVGLASTAGHWLVILAFRHGSASLLAPFSYVQILSATLLGFLVFGAVPDLWTFIGSGVIIASGLYTAHRERVRAQTPA